MIQLELINTELRRLRKAAKQVAATGSKQTGGVADADARITFSAVPRRRRK